MNNACLHNLGRAQRCVEASKAEILPNPGCSPDQALSDFFLFGHIKGKLSYYNSESQEDLLNTIPEILTGVDQEVLRCIFESWVNRLK
jgi:hypothetical protein